jgi:hypothetical protein
MASSSFSNNSEFKRRLRSSSLVHNEHDDTVHDLDEVDCSDNDYDTPRDDSDNEDTSIAQKDKGLYYTGNDDSKRLASMHSMMIEYLIPSLKIVMSVQKDVQVVKSEQQKQMQTLTKKVVKMEHELKSVKTENQRLSIANDLLCDKINRLES